MGLLYFTGMETVRRRRLRGSNPTPTVAGINHGGKVQLFRPREAGNNDYIAGDSSIKALFKTMTDTAMVIAGLVLITTGLCGLGFVIASPFNATGGVVYILAGIFITLSHSESLRFYSLKSLSTNMYEMLYEKSILEIMMEPSPYMKAFILILLSGTLEDQDMNELVNSLPPSCDILKKKGMINLLPRMVNTYTLIPITKTIFQ